MSSFRQTTPANWDASGRITATAETTVSVTETDGYRLYYAVTDTDAVPAFSENFGHPIEARATAVLTLKAGERLWIVRPNGPGSATVSTEAAGGVSTLLASAARTASGDSGAIGAFGGVKTIRAQLDVTAVAGTAPTLDVVLEDTLDGVNWYTVGTFAQKAAAGREVIDITAPFTDTLRVRWSIAGTTPSFTFSVLGYLE